ncbi:MAG: uroporphyrinogen decarboxylase family protein [Promethearchaeota archaeon]|jgi:uroporphyrinogen-III decarboxylase
MNARERVLKTLNHEEPDRVPLFCQAIMPGFARRIVEYWGKDYEPDDKYTLFFSDYNLHRKLGFDCAWGFGVVPVKLPKNFLKENPPPQLNDSDKFVDIDGRIYLRNSEFNVDWYYGNYITTEEMADYFYDRYYAIEWEENSNFIPKLNKTLSTYPTDEILPIAHINSILEPIWEGIGLSLFTKLLRKKKSKLKKYIDLRTKIAVAGSKVLAGTDFEVFFLCDDTAFKKRTMISPKDHRELIIPAYKKILHAINKAGKYAVFHSDGYTEPYFEGLIEAGFKAVESLEPMAGMDLKYLKEAYGDKLCLIGNIDVSELLPFGTTDDVKESVKKCINDAAEGGGYILSPCTDITNACKIENILTMISATKEYGKYPLMI